MNVDHRWIGLTACNVLLLMLSAVINDGLASWSLSVFLAGPCVVWAAMRLRPLGLVACVALSGLAGEAAWPTPPGFLVTLFVLGAAFTVFIRPWLGRASRPSQIALAWLLNGAYFGALTVWASTRGGGAVFWERIAADFCLSQLLILPVGLWFFAFQESVLQIAGLPVAQEPATSR
jgi:hypothetical protein